MFFVSGKFSLFDLGRGGGPPPSAMRLLDGQVESISVKANQKLRVLNILAKF